MRITPVTTVRSSVVLTMTVAAALSGVSPAAADKVTVKLDHGPVSATLVPVTEGQASPGDLRLYFTPLTRPGKSKRVGALTGSLLTTAVDQPEKGKELRSADLVFTVKESQLVVGGVATYDTNAPTVARKSSVIRPVLGGSGKYAGARGWCKSIHYKNNTWRHVFKVRVDKG